MTHDEIRQRSLEYASGKYAKPKPLTEQQQAARRFAAMLEAADAEEFTLIPPNAPRKHFSEPVNMPKSSAWVGTPTPDDQPPW